MLDSQLVEKMKEIVRARVAPPPDPSSSVTALRVPTNDGGGGGRNVSGIQTALDGMQGELVAGLRLEDVLRHSPGNSLRLLKGEIIDVNGKQAPSEDLTGWNWKQINSARGANFADSNLKAVLFPNRMDFTRASLQGANLEFAKFPRGGTKFIGANLEDTLLIGAKLPTADFTGANLKNAALWLYSDLRGAVFNRTNLEGASLQGANLSGARFTNCTGSSASALYNGSTPFAQAWSTNLNRANLTRATFNKQDVSFFSFNNANIQGADFRTARNIDSIKTATGVIYSPAGSKYPTQFPPGFTPPSHWIARPLNH
jgi:uncharacterized protein YjbI with pentapeptide repeats